MSVPRHIGIILDGNRRFAKRLMLKPWKGHEWGAKKFREFLDWCGKAGVEEVTAYVFSIQNFNRPKEEFDYLMNIFKTEFEALLEPEHLQKLNDDGVRVIFIGRQHLLPKALQDVQNRLMDATKHNRKKRLNFALAYGGREEIIEAVQRLAEQAKEGTIDPQQINEEVFGNELWLDSDPDLIIRTGGEQRTSNFLPWQSTYSELIFIEKFWPDLEEDDFLACIKEYERRERRFGK